MLRAFSAVGVASCSKQRFGSLPLAQTFDRLSTKQFLQWTDDRAFNESGAVTQFATLTRSARSMVQFVGQLTLRFQKSGIIVGGAINTRTARAIEKVFLSQNFFPLVCDRHSARLGTVRNAQLAFSSNVSQSNKFDHAVRSSCDQIRLTTVICSRSVLENGTAHADAPSGRATRHRIDKLVRQRNRVDRDQQRKIKNRSGIHSIVQNDGSKDSVARQFSQLVAFPVSSMSLPAARRGLAYCKLF